MRHLIRPPGVIRWNPGKCKYFVYVKQCYIYLIFNGKSSEGQCFSNCQHVPAASHGLRAILGSKLKIGACTSTKLRWPCLAVHVRKLY